MLRRDGDSTYEHSMDTNTLLNNESKGMPQMLKSNMHQSDDDQKCNIQNGQKQGAKSRWYNGHNIQSRRMGQNKDKWL